MSGTYPVVVGDRGRLVLPAELRARWQLTPGSVLMLIETPQGLVLTTREQLKTLVREELQGPSLVEELLVERRAAAVRDDAG